MLGDPTLHAYHRRLSRSFHPWQGRNVIELGPHRRHTSSGCTVYSVQCCTVRCVHTGRHELGFGSILHKVQGQIVSRVILNLEKPRSRDGRIPTALLYVGLTRVRRYEDMRVFSLSPGSSLDHLLELHRDATFAALVRVILCRWCLAG